MKNKILLIEDDRSITKMVQSYLEKEGFIVTAALNEKEGIVKLTSDFFDLVIFDSIMLELDEGDIVKLIKERNTIPIFLMSTKGSNIDKTVDLDFVDYDYIFKPFSMIELLARIKAVIRRAAQYSMKDGEGKFSSVINFHELTVDLKDFSVIKRKEKIKLTPKEFEILKLFITNPKRVFTKSQIYSYIWKDIYLGEENLINVYMRKLREKIEDDPSNPKYIKTLWGIGYKLEEF